MLSETVLAILMVILFLTVAFPNVISFVDTGKSNKARADTAVLSGLIAQYHLEVGEYPGNLNALTKTVGQYGPWLNESLKDPWTNGEYYYILGLNKFIVYSGGPDKSSNSNLTNGITGDDIGFVGK